MTVTNVQTPHYPRVHRLTVYFLILLSVVIMAGCRRSAEHEEPAEQVASTVAPTTEPTVAATIVPTVAPTATDSPTPVIEATEEALAEETSTEEAPDSVETPADATKAGAEETPAPLADTDEVEPGDALTGTVDAAGIVETNAISVAGVLNPVSEEKNPEEEKSVEPAPATEETPVPASTSARPLDDTLNILVLGSDRRPGAPNWRTDVIMIVALDMENGRVGVISIPRDVYVNRPPGGYNSNKINTMDYFGEANHPGGGPELLSAIIEQKMGIPIHHFVRFNFETFEKVVDALGGVEVEFDCSFYGDLGGRSKQKKLVLEPGVHRLDGDQAIIYVRSRAVGGDLDRAERQQRFVWSIRQQALSENLLPKLPALYSALSGSVQTDIGLIDAVRLARFVVDLEPADVHAFVVAPPDMLSYGRSRRLSYFYPHWTVIAERAQKIFDTKEFVETNEIVNSRGRECK